MGSRANLLPFSHPTLYVLSVINSPLAALQVAEPSATKVAQQQQPEHQVSAVGQVQQGDRQGTHQSMTFSQHLHKILDTAQDALARMKQQQGQNKDQGESAAGNEAMAH